MTTPVHHVNTSDATFMQEMIDLLRTAVQDGAWAGEMASHHSGDPRLRSLAQESSTSAARQIKAMISCLEDWNAETHQPVHTAAPPEARPSATSGTIGYDVELADLHGSRFDARVARNLVAHHRAVIARSQREMIEGLNSRSRDFARTSIVQHSGDLQRLEEGLHGAPDPTPRDATLARRGDAWVPAVRRGPLPTRGAPRRSAPPCLP